MQRKDKIFLTERVYFMYDGIEGFVHDLRSTVRECVDCGCLVAGGPTRCGRCAKDFEWTKLSFFGKLKTTLRKWI